VFDEGQHSYQSYYNKDKIYTSISEGNVDKYIFIVDGQFKADLKKSTTRADLQEIQELYNNSTKQAQINVKSTNNYDIEQYPYSTNLTNKRGGRVEIRGNY
jgi:hypothetical protein